MNERIPEELLENVLSKLGFSHRPLPTYEGLSQIYGAWCRNIPFDNVRKLIHMRAADPGALPGSSAEDFFDAWLHHGTGGTCWAGAGAMQALLASLGFDSVRGIGTMLAAPNIPPNHGTVAVTLDGRRYLVDTGMICGEPLLLDETKPTSVDHPAWGLGCSTIDGHWYIAWRPLHKPKDFQCRLEHFNADDEAFQMAHEQTRPWSPFNYELTMRKNVGDQVVGIAFGNAITFHTDGSVASTPLTPEERSRILLEDIGLSEEIVSRLPADEPTPPPPGSRTAEAAGER